MNAEYRSMADQPQDSHCRLPRLPQLPSTGCSSCSSSSSLTTQRRRQETAEIRRQWKQSRQIHKLVLKPKLPVGGSTTLPSLTVAAASGYHNNRYEPPTQDRTRLPQLANSNPTELPALTGYEVKQRPNYVLRISLPPPDSCREKWRPAVSTKPTLSVRREKTAIIKDSKYFFVSPEWDSERHTLEKFRQSGQLDILKQSWM